MILEIMTIGRKPVEIILDEVAYEKIKEYQWRVKRKKEEYYFYTFVDGKVRGINSILYDSIDDPIVIHKNGIPYDFRSENIEVMSRSDFMHGCRKSNQKKRSQYKNVTWSELKQKWITRIIKDSEVAYERYFQDEYDAAIVADYEMRKLYGEYAMLNFPDIEADELKRLYSQIIDQFGGTREEIKSRAQQGVKSKMGKSRFTGVGLDKRRGVWYARIKKDKKTYFLGNFTDERAAAQAYNEKAIELYGIEAKINAL